MDPTAPPNNNPQNPNNSSPQGPSSPTSSLPQQASPWSLTPNPPTVSPAESQETPIQNNPILPGQYVESQEYIPPQSNIPLQPSPTQDTPRIFPQAQTTDPPQTPDLAYANLPIDHQITTPQAPVVASQINPQEIPSVQSPLTSGTQPDPTPFVPPNLQSTPQGFSKPPGRIKNLRVVIIIFGIIILLIIIGVIAWFLFSANKSEEAAKTQSEQSSQPAISQPPIPARTRGGFSELNATASSAIPTQESTPAATNSTNP